MSPLASAVIGPPAAEQRVMDSNMEFAAQNQHAQQDSPHEVVFVDTRTPDYALLVRDIAEQSGRELDVVMLDAARDGLEQISDALAGRENVAALHIIAHGSEGVMQLGPSAVTADALQRNSLQVEAWGKALTADADILLYGCDVASTAQGQLLADTLARLTGADVSASDDVTGNATLGGDWNLEYATGLIEAHIALSQGAQELWGGVLATVTVTTTADLLDGNTSSIAALIANQGADGKISLREAVIAANGTALADTISLGAGTYTLTRVGANENAASTGDLDITEELTINGAGADVTFVSGGLLDRVFEVRGATVVMAGLTIQNGSVADGAGINVDATSSVTLRNAALSGNTATGNGGAMFLSGTLVLDRVTIDGNTASQGGGIYVNDGATASLSNVTMSGNNAITNGGAILARGAISLTNATIASNSATLGAGGIHEAGPGAASLRNTILANNTGGNANGALTSLGHNIDSGNTAALSGSGDQINTNPMLGALQYNGGPTKTHALLAGSPAINPAGLSGAPGFDQRGYTRDATPDIGAYEFGGASPSAGFWITTEGDVPSSGVNGLNAWMDGDVLRFSDPDLALEPGGSGGTLSLVFNMDQFAANGTAEIDAIHFVGRNITVAGMQLLFGDVLFSTVLGENFTSSNTLLNVEDSDLIVFRPNVAGNYSAGTFLMLLDESAVSAANDWLDLNGIALVEKDTLVGNTTLQAGSFLLLEGASASRKNIQLFTPTSVGATTNGTLQVLFDGVEAGTGTAFDGLDLIEEPTTIGGTTLAAGTIVVSQDNSADIFSLTVSTTELGGTGVSAGTLTLLLDGPAVGLNSGNENIRALTLIPGSASTNTAPVADLNAGGAGQDVTVAFTEQTPVLVAPVGTLADVDSANLASLTVTLTARPDGNAVESLALNAAAATAASGAGLTVSYTAATGVLSVTGSATVATYQTILQGIQYSNTSDAPTTSARSVTVVANDGALPSATQSSTITVTPVNDAPVLTGDLSATVLEGGSYTITGTDLGYSDPDDVDAGVSFTVSALTNGTVRVGGVAVTSFTGTQLVAGAVSFLHDGGETTAASFNVLVEDGNEDGSTPVASTFNLTVTPVNDAPVLTGDLSATVLEGGSYTITGTDLGYSDPDDVDAGVSFTVSALTNGTVRVGGVAVTSFTGTQLVAGAVSFLHDGGETTAASFNVLVEDGNEDGSTPVASTFNLTVTPVNDAPVLTGDLSATVLEGGSYTITGTDLGYSDPDDVDAGVSFTVSALTNGTVRVGGVAVTSFTGTQLVAGAVSFLHDGGETTAASFNVLVEDGNEDGSTPVASTFNLTVTPVNDAPVLTGDLSATVLEGGSYTITGTDLGYSDPDDVDAGVSFTVSALTNGTVRVGGVAVTSFTGTQLVAGAVSFLHDGGETTAASFNVLVEDGNEDGSTPVASTFNLTVTPVNDAPVLTGDLSATVLEGGSYTITGTDLGYSDPDDVDAGVSFTVSALTNGTVRVGGVAVTSFTGTQLVAGAVSFLHDGGETTAASFNVLVEDGNEDGSTPVASTFNLTVTPVNDAPVLTGDLSATVLEGGSYTITGTDLGYSDPDDVDAGVSFTVSALTNGTVRVGGVAVTSFTGTQLVAGAVSFLHDGGETTAASFNVLVEDGNEDGSTPVASTFNLTVTPVNDAPVLTGDLSATVLEGGSYTITGTDLGYSDPDDVDAGVSFTVSALTNGTVRVGGVAVTSFTGTQLVAGAVSFLHDGGETTAASFNVLVEDGNEDGSTPVASTFNLTVTPVNDAPVLTGDLSATVLEGGSYTITGTDLGYSDPDDVDAGVSFTVSALTNGTVRVGGVAVTSFTGTQLVAGAVSFLHDGGETTAASFNVLVEDGNEDGSTPVASTFNLTVTPVNDAPVLTGDLSATVLEGGSYTITGTDLGYSDPDDVDAGVSFTVSALTNGTVRVGGVAVTSFTGTQLVAGAVSFLHDGGETTAASFNVLVEDGNEDGSTPVASTFNLTVTPVNDAPVLTGDLSATVLEGGSYTITGTDLGYSDPDDVDAGVSFTVSALTNGTVRVGGVAVTSFTGTQLVAGAVSFLHDGGETTAASFNVLVEDGNEDGSTPVASTFNLTVTPVNDAILVSYEPPFTDLGDQGYEIKAGQPWGQTFSHDSGAGTYVVGKIELVLYKSTTGAGPGVVVELRDAFSGGTIFASGSVARADLGTTEAWVSITLSVPVTLNDNQTYFIRVSGTGPGQDYVGVHDAGTYADGDLINKDGVAQTPKDMAFRLIEVTNTAPVADLNAGVAGQDVTVAFTEQTPVLVAPAGTLADVDSATLASLTATLAARPDGDAVESLSLDAAATTAASGLTVSYTAATGALSITGSATIATYQTILQGILYNNTSDAPTTTDRSVTVLANDGALPSATQSSTITVAPVNDAPVLTGDLSATVLEGGSYTITGTDLGYSDPDDVDAGVSFTVSALTNGTVRVGGVAVTSFTGTQLVAGAVSFVHDGGETTAASFNVLVEDGNEDVSTPVESTFNLTVTPLNDAPVNTVPGVQSVNEDTALLIAGLSVNDDGNLATTQLSVASGMLNVSLAGGASISAGGNGTGTLTLSGTQAQVNAALAALSYQGNLNFNGVDMLTVLSTDSAGVPLSDTDTVALTVAAVNDAPVASAGATLAYTQKGVSAAIDGSITLSDADDTQLTGATVTIAAPVAGDTLAFVVQSGITGGFAGGVLTLTGSATLADYEAALRSVTYSSSATDPTLNSTRPTRTITWTVTDASSAAIGATSTVNLGGLAALIGDVGIDPGLAGTPPPAASTPPPVTATSPTPSGTGFSPTVVPGSAHVAASPVSAVGDVAGDIGAFLADIVQRSQQLQTGGAPAGASQRGSAATGAAGAAAAVGALSAGLDIGPLANAQAQASPVFVLEEFLKGGSRATELVDSLDRLRDEMDEKTRREHMVNGTAAAVGMSLTVGYLLWLARGGILLSSLMASLPAWRLLDPLPVLGRMSDDEDDVAEDDSAMPSADTAEDSADELRETRSA